MKPLLLVKNTQSPGSSFLALKTDVPHLYDRWHYHRELELLYVIKGKGTRFIGDSVQKFYNGDIVLVGANLPHVWKNNAEYYENDQLNARAILIQFVEDIFGEKLLVLPEMKAIQELLLNARRGVRIGERTRKTISPILEKIVTAKGAKKMILLLSVLEEIANGNYELLSSSWFSKSYTEPKKERIHAVYDHIMSHFTQKVTLQALADVASMNEAALCRYFKARTKKTITEFINEVRVGYAFNLLSSKDCLVTQACFEAGFNNLSYFNRQFKKFVGYPPSEVRKRLITNVSSI